MCIPIEFVFGTLKKTNLKAKAYELTENQNSNDDIEIS